MKTWTIDEIAEDIAKDSKYKAPEQIDVMIRLARRVVELLKLAEETRDG